MIRFEDLLDRVRAYHPDADIELLRRAYVFSALEHKGQVRHSGEPYLVHPLEVADILAAARALCELSPENRKPLKTEGHLSRDPRAKERRKYGLKKARKAPQFSKR